MAAAICRIEKKNGVDVAFNEDGSINQIYQEALINGLDNQTALNLYLVSEMGSFKKISSDNSLDSLVKYTQEIALPNTKLTEEELLELTLNLEKTNQKLSTYVRSVEDPEMRLKVQSFIDQGGVVENVPKRVTTYENDNGTKVTVQQIENEIIQSIEDFTSEDQIENAVLALPYTEYVENYLGSQAVRNKLFDRLKDFKRIPTLSVKDDILIRESRRETVLSNTIQVRLSPVGIRSIRRILDDISADVWEENREEAREIVKELEKEYVELGLDIIGLSETVTDKDSLEIFIGVTEKMLKTPNLENQKLYLEELEAIFPEGMSDPIIKVPTRHKSKTLVYFDSNLPHSEIFDKYRLFPVKGNVFHAIDQSLTDNNVIETFYGRMLNSEISLPQVYQTTENPMNIENRLNVMADIRVYLTEYKGRVVSETNNIIASGVELLNDYEIVAPKNASNVTTDPSYLKGDFVSDFNKYILEEKLKDSIAYREILSNFYVGNSDIILKNPVESIENVKFQKELEDYIRLKRDSSMDYLLPIDDTNLVTEDIQTLNDPTKVSPFPLDSVVENDYVMTPVSLSMYYRQGNSLYRKVKEDSNVSLYSKLRDQGSVIYFDTNTNFDTSKSEVSDVFERLSKLQQFKNSQKSFDFKPSILKNQINLLRLYTEKEQRDIDNKTDKCK